MKRKKIAIALSAALSVSVLAGCGGSDNGSNVWCINSTSS